MYANIIKKLIFPPSPITVPQSESEKNPSPTQYESAKAKDHVIKR
jgi:hypothetical protein